MDESPLRRLMYRWLVEFNPLYLLSAALVLGGATLISRGLAHYHSLVVELGVGAIAEVYALCLIGGAALLTRIGQRRPAVMLALLAVLYQGDLTLHTETCAYLGWTGLLAVAMWLALFVGKLSALGWAMKLRISPSAIAVATLGALGIALFPANLLHLSSRNGTALVALWLFALVSAGLYLPCSVVSRAPLDGWGRTVLGRAVRASWAILGVLSLFHVAFWSTQYGLDLAVLIPAALLVAVRWIRGEARVWGLVIGTMTLTGWESPALFSVVAFMATGALTLRALFSPAVPSVAERVGNRGGPYRAAETERWVARLAEPSSRGACLRMLIGALFSAYLATWTLSWTGGALPAHGFALDLGLTLFLAFVALRLRSWPVLTPLSAVYAHWAVQVGLVSAPRSTLHWGLTSVGVGFALLVGSLGASFRLRGSASRNDRDELITRTA